MFTFLGVIAGALVTGVLIIVLSLKSLSGPLSSHEPTRRPAPKPEGPAPKLTKLGRPIEIQHVN